MAAMGPRLLAALNGDRDHPATPRTAEEIAADAARAAGLGVASIHVHAYDDDGRQTLEPTWCAEAIRAVRGACRGTPISLTTFAAVEPDARRRYALIKRWTELPDLVTANQGEEGIIELCELLWQRGVGIEAGLLTVGDAEAFVRAGIWRRCVRVLVEPLDADPAEALAHAAEIQEVLAHGGVALAQFHHGEGIASWSVNERAAARGLGIRTGLEDTPVLPDGRLAAGNAELLDAAAEILRRYA